MATKKAKGKSKPAPRRANKEAKPMTKTQQGYAGHNAGSRNGTIHELFDEQGEEVAWTRGIKIGLKGGTLRSWFGAWRRKTGRPQKPAKKPSAKTSSSAAPALEPTTEQPAVTEQPTA